MIWWNCVPRVWRFHPGDTTTLWVSWHWTAEKTVVVCQLVHCRNLSLIYVHGFGFNTVYRVLLKIDSLWVTHLLHGLVMMTQLWYSLSWTWDRWAFFLNSHPISCPFTLPVHFPFNPISLFYCLHFASLPFPLFFISFLNLVPVLLIYYKIPLISLPIIGTSVW